MTQFGAKICQTKEAATFVACDVSQNRATVQVNFSEGKELVFSNMVNGRPIHVWLNVKMAHGVLVE